MGGACSTHARDEKCVQNFGQSKGIDHLEDLGVDRNIILQCILRKYGGKLLNGLI